MKNGIGLIYFVIFESEMNKTAYISLLKDSLENESLATFKMDELVDSFPYHATSHILMAKSASKYGSMYATKKLKHAALFSPNRAFLRKLFSDSTQIETQKTVDKIEYFATPFLPTIESELADLEIIESEISSAQIEIEHTEIPVLVEEKREAAKSDLDFINKFYVHVNGFGNSPKTIKQDLLSEFLAYRGEIVFENAPLDFQQNIIQKFLEEEPKISRFEPQAIETGKTDLSKRSTTENDDLITENMATIFVKQNKYKRAIEVYQKLILKYPEKEPYFAEKIISIQYQI